jgi:hypothetical protein
LESSNLGGHTDNNLSGSLAAQILKDLLSSGPRYRQMVAAFDALARLESDQTFLQSLKADADGELAQEQRATELKRERERKAEEASHTRSEPEQGVRPQAERSKALKAGWDTLIIPKSLRENLQAYCRILHNYEARLVL